MHDFNLSRWSLGHRQFIGFLVAVAAVAGLLSYLSLGRKEDPEFTVKTMMITVGWPGASAALMGQQVIKPLETMLTENIPEIDYVKSKALPGRATLNVTLISTAKSSRIPDIWYNVRKTVNDNRADLPDGIVGPGFNDEFGTTYGNIYAITGQGFGEPTLRRYAKTLRDRVQQLPDVAKTQLVGDQDEAVYVTYDSARLARSGITAQTIADALKATNAVSASGIVEPGPERVRLQVSGAYEALENMASTPIMVDGKSLPLASFATIERKAVDPASFAMRFDGAKAVGVGISPLADGNVARLGEELASTVAQLQSEMPLGLKIETVSDQTRVVDESVSEFTRSLFEAILIVLAVNFLSLGWRPGIVVALCIPLVLAMTFTAMLYMGIDLQRISLGALIIALGLLVDDAIFVVEWIATHLEAGWTRTVDRGGDLHAVPRLPPAAPARRRTRRCGRTRRAVLRAHLQLVSQRPRRVPPPPQAGGSGERGNLRRLARAVPVRGAAPVLSRLRPAGDRRRSPALAQRQLCPDA